MKASQLELGKVQCKNQWLLSESESGGNVSSSSGSQPSKQQQQQQHLEAVDAALAANKELVSELGKQYFLMYEPWLDQTVFRQPPPAQRIDDHVRYRTAENQRAAQILDLYKFIPRALHPMVSLHGGFGRVVRLKSFTIHLPILTKSRICFFY